MKKFLSKIINWNIPLPLPWIVVIAAVVVFLIYLALAIYMGYEPICVLYLFFDIGSQLLISTPFFIIAFFITSLFMSLIFRLNRNLSIYLFAVLLIVIMLLFPFCFFGWIFQPLAHLIDRITSMGIKASHNTAFTISLLSYFGLLIGLVYGSYKK